MDHAEILGRYASVWPRFASVLYNISKEPYDRPSSIGENGVFAGICKAGVRVTSAMPQAPAFTSGFALGFVIAAPVGPTSALYIALAIASGAAAVMATGYGAATIHMAYVLCLATGAWIVIDPGTTIPTIEVASQVFCSTSLIHLAIKVARRLIPTVPGGAARGRQKGHVASLTFNLLPNGLYRRGGPPSNFLCDR